MHLHGNRVCVTEAETAQATHCGNRRGLFITLEGADGSGKTTQIKRLAERLQGMGREVVVSREPGGCAISERIRNLVLDAKVEGMSDKCEALLFAAARAQHVDEVIRPALERGAVVLCDRFVDSSVAYQGVARNLGMALVQQMNAPAVAECMPDLTLLLMLDPDEGMRRRISDNAPDRIEKERSDFTHRVADGYRVLATLNPERFRVVDENGKTREQVAELVWDAVKEMFD